MSKQTFTQKGDFRAYYAAEAWCRENGISCGSMERRQPIGLMRGEVIISKWTNMTRKEQAELHGTMTSDSFRDGPVVVEMKDGAA